MQDKEVRKSLRAAALIGEYLRGDITAEGMAELEAWVGSSQGSISFMKEITDAGKLQREIEAFGQASADEKWERLLDKAILRETERKKQARRVTWMSAAAALAVAAACWLVLSVYTGKNFGDNLTANKYGTDIPPGSQKGELVLGDGRTVHLITGSDTVLLESGSEIYGNGKGLVYRQAATTAATQSWNILRTPAGGEYMLTLGDGTTVWLNSQSSLRYPVCFSGAERKVELVGEAFFHVAKDKTKPFTVTAGGIDVLAVGTSFNINSYIGKDSSSVTTLEEGRIKVTTRTGKGLMVEPGEQVRVSENKMLLTKGDVEVATAWKRGLFVFKGAPLEEVMTRLGRWYDVQVKYGKAFVDSGRFTGRIKKDLPLADVLTQIEMTGIAGFSVKDKTITVLPYGR